MEDWTLRTPALYDATRVRVLLPAGYAADPDRRYPVLYLLHGADSDYRSWTRYGDAEAITAHAPMIVVMPDGGAEGWYTDWYQGDRPVQPRWETYHVGELIPWVDATYRTIAARRGRAIAGLSMGGYGALSYAARHPGTFAAAASFSGALEIGSADAWGSAAPTRRAGARTSRSRSPRGCGRSRSSSCARATEGRGPLDRAAPAGLPGLRARALPAPRQRAPARAPAGARASATCGTTTGRDARLAVLAPRPARDAARPAARARPRLTTPGAHAPTRLRAEGAPQRVVGRLAGLALDEHAPPAPGERLGRAVAAHVDAAVRAGPGHLAAQRDLLDRRELARERALAAAPLAGRELVEARLQRGQRLGQRGEALARG